MSKNLLKEILRISTAVLIMGAVQIAVTAFTKFFGIATIFGTILGCLVAIVNFTLMGVILEKSISKGKGASSMVGFGYIGRLIIIALAVVWAIKVDYLNYVCVVIPLIFPQIAIFILNLGGKKGEKNDERT